MNDNERGIRALQEERHEEAIEAFMNAIETNPEDPVAYINIGNVFAAVNDIERAEQFFQQAIALDERAATAYYSLANVYYNVERFEEAAKLYEKAIQYEMTGADAHYMLAKCFEQLGQDKLALPYAQRAAELNVKDEQIQVTYGILLSKLELFEEAAKTFRHVLKLNEDHVDAHYNLGMVYAVSTDDREAAKHHLQRAFTIEPEHTQARYIYDMIELGEQNER